MWFSLTTLSHFCLELGVVLSSYPWEFVLLWTSSLTCEHMLGETLLSALGPGLDTAHGSSHQAWTHCLEEGCWEAASYRDEIKSKGDQQTKFVSRKGRDRTGVKSQIPAEMSRGWEELSEAAHCGGYQEPTGSPDKHNGCCSSCRPSVGADHVAPRVLSSFLFSFCGHVTLLSRLRLISLHFLTVVSWYTGPWSKL